MLCYFVCINFDVGVFGEMCDGVLVEEVLCFVVLGYKVFFIVYVGSVNNILFCLINWGVVLIEVGVEGVLLFFLC